MTCRAPEPLVHSQQAENGCSEQGAGGTRNAYDRTSLSYVQLEGACTSSNGATHKLEYA
jgi:hypothetical protein